MCSICAKSACRAPCSRGPLESSSTLGFKSDSSPTHGRLQEPTARADRPERPAVNRPAGAREQGRRQERQAAAAVSPLPGWRQSEADGGADGGRPRCRVMPQQRGASSQSKLAPVMVGEARGPWKSGPQKEGAGRRCPPAACTLAAATPHGHYCHDHESQGCTLCARVHAHAWRGPPLATVVRGVWCSLCSRRGAGPGPAGHVGLHGACGIAWGMDAPAGAAAIVHVHGATMQSRYWLAVAALPPQSLHKGMQRREEKGIALSLRPLLR